MFEKIRANTYAYPTRARIAGNDSQYMIHAFSVGQSSVYVDSRALTVIPSSSDLDAIRTESNGESKENKSSFPFRFTIDVSSPRHASIKGEKRDGKTVLAYASASYTLFADAANIEKPRNFTIYSVTINNRHGLRAELRELFRLFNVTGVDCLNIETGEINSVSEKKQLEPDTIYQYIKRWTDR